MLESTWSQFWGSNLGKKQYHAFWPNFGSNICSTFHIICDVVSLCWPVNHCQLIVKKETSLKFVQNKPNAIHLQPPGNLPGKYDGSMKFFTVRA